MITNVGGQSFEVGLLRDGNPSKNFSQLNIDQWRSGSAEDS